MSNFELGDEATLVWWRPTGAKPGADWLKLHNHPCGGFSCNSLDGWVKPIRLNKLALKLVIDIADEKFAVTCAYPRLDYEVSTQHKSAYDIFLRKSGLVPGDMKFLQQAVYPLEADAQSLKYLSSGDELLEPMAKLLILGQNCD